MHLATVEWYGIAHITHTHTHIPGCSMFIARAMGAHAPPPLTHLQEEAITKAGGEAQRRRSVVGSPVSVLPPVLCQGSECRLWE